MNGRITDGSVGDVVVPTISPALLMAIAVLSQIQSLQQPSDPTSVNAYRTVSAFTCAGAAPASARAHTRVAAGTTVDRNRRGRRWIIGCSFAGIGKKLTVRERWCGVRSGGVAWTKA